MSKSLSFHDSGVQFSSLFQNWCSSFDKSSNRTDTVMPVGPNLSSCSESGPRSLKSTSAFSNSFVLIAPTERGEWLSSKRLRREDYSYLNTKYWQPESRRDNGNPECVY